MSRCGPISWLNPLDELACDAFQFALREFRRFAGDTTFGAAKRDVYDRGFPSHQRRQCPHVIGIQRWMKTQAAFGWSARGIVLEAVSAEDRQFAVVTLDRNRDMMLGLKRQQQSLDARSQVHDPRSLADVVIGGFKGIHSEAQISCGLFRKTMSMHSVVAPIEAAS